MERRSGGQAVRWAGGQVGRWAGGEVGRRESVRIHYVVSYRTMCIMRRVFNTCLIDHQ